MIILSKAQLKKASGRIFKEIEIPEMGGGMRLGSLGAGAALALNAMLDRQAKGEELQREMMLHLILSSVVDEESKPMFDAESAAAFIEQISIQTLSLIAHSVPKTEGKAAGNSEASPAVG